MSEPITKPKPIETVQDLLDALGKFDPKTKVEIDWYCDGGSLPIVQVIHSDDMPLRELNKGYSTDTLFLRT